MADKKPYKIVTLDAKEKKRIQKLVKKLALEGAIGIDEHIYRDNRAYDRWGINPFELFEFISRILDNPNIKRKELHDTEYFPTRYLCEFESNLNIYPCIIGIKESNQGLVIVITILDQKKRFQ